MLHLFLWDYLTLQLNESFTSWSAKSDIKRLIHKFSAAVDTVQKEESPCSKCHFVHEKNDVKLNKKMVGNEDPKYCH